jgi:hypothetical protein
MEKEWFYRQAGRVHGPLTIQDVRAALLLRFLKPDALVRAGERGDWKPAWQVRELRALAPRPDAADSGAADP